MEYFCVALARRGPRRERRVVRPRRGVSLGARGALRRVDVDANDAERRMTRAATGGRVMTTVRAGAGTLAASL